MSIPKFSDYVVYVDESGDHSLDSIDPDYPLFVLAFCIIDKEAYSNVIVPNFQKLKFDFWGHDMTILHEHEIRKKKGDHDILMRKEVREPFMDRLNTFLEDAPFQVVATIIQKKHLQGKDHPDNPYYWSLHSCLKRCYRFLLEKGQADRKTYIVAEARGAREDRELELEFLRLCRENEGWNTTFGLRVANKQVNSCGLQLADLLARPIGIHSLKPEQTNRAHEIIQTKYYRDGDNGFAGAGLEVFPSVTP